MRKGLISLLCLICGVAKLHAQNSEYEMRVRGYIEQYSSWAVAEQKRSGIPAAITLAQGIHETSAGTSELATMANNHFGIKCKKEWTGETFAHTDDAPNECFRKYPSSKDSYVDHSDYLAKSPRYAELFKLSPTDYAAWAMGLKRCGYATNPRYAQVLIKLIEEYHLQEFTYTALNSAEIGTGYVPPKAEIVPLHDKQPEAAISKPAIAETKPVALPVTTMPVVTPVAKGNIVTANTSVPQAVAALKPEYGQVVKINGLRAIYARKGDTPLEYAYKGDIRYSKFLEINEIDERPLPNDMYLYLDKKRTRGMNPKHLVKQGETLFGIAQAEGIMIKSLMDLNMLSPGEEPLAGTVLQLQTAVASKPAVASKKNSVATVVPPSQIVNAAPQQTAINTTSEIARQGQNVPMETIPPATVTSVTAQQTQERAEIVAQQNIQLKKEPVQPVIEQPVQQAAPTIQATESGITSIQQRELEQPVAPNAAIAVTDPTVEESGKEVIKQPIIQTLPAPDVAPNTVLKEELSREKNTLKSEPQPMVMEPVTTVDPLPLQNSQTVQVQQPDVVVNTVATPEMKREEEPVDELDKLKRKFDKVVYAKPAPNTSVATAVVKQEEIKAENIAVQEKKPTTLAASNDPSKYYTVKRGDTGYSIAKAHRISLKQLMEWNGLDFNDIKEGEKLRIKP